MKVTSLKLFLVSATLVGMSSVSNAAVDCSELAQEAKETGKNQLVVTFEGLFGYALGAPVKNYVIRRAVNEGLTSNFTPSDYSWTSVDAAHQCVLDWREVHGKKMRLAVLGHSFGGSYGVFGLLKKLEVDGITADNVITMDARTHGNDVAFWATRNRVQYSKPKNTKTFINFWERRDALPGYIVDGTTNIEVTTKAHINLPSDERIYQVFKAMVLGKESSIQGILKKGADQ